MELTFKQHRNRPAQDSEHITDTDRARVEEGERYKCGDNLQEVSSTLIAPVETSLSLTELNREFDNDENEAYNDSVGIQHLLHILTATTQ